MKKTKIKVRSIVYSLVGILAAGIIYFLLYVQIPESVVITPVVNQIPNREEPGYPEDEIVGGTVGEGVLMNGFIMGDNAYHVRSHHIPGFINREVFRYERWNPTAFIPPAAIETGTTPGATPNAGTTTDTETESDEKDEEEPESITITLPGGEEIPLKYVSGNLPVSKDLYNVSKIYGMDGAEFHYGVDIEKEGIDGKEVYSVLPGVVSLVGYEEDTYGNYIVISHGTVSTLYGQLKEKPVISMGTSIREGELLGYVGSTGKADKPHLHFEMDVDGVRFNPELFIKEILK